MFSILPMENIHVYQRLLTNAVDVPINDISQACIEVQEYCLYQHTTNEYLKILEQLVMVYYTKLYPSIYGGIFEPLSKTIWFTHCHFLYADKFSTFDKNQYRAKCNLLTNCIEWLPDAIQPIHIWELIHMLHLISYIQNTYYDKHMAALAFTNKDDIVWWRFCLVWQKLVIVWNDDDAFDAYVNKWYTLSQSACDIILYNWHEFPMFQHNKQLFIDYLNSRGNKAMQEIMYSEFLLPDLRKYLERTSTSFQLWRYNEIIKNEYDNIHFTRWLLYTQRETGKSRDEVIQLYQSYIDEYIQQDDTFEKVYCISNSLPWEIDHAFAPFHDKLRRLLKERYTWYYDYSPDIVKKCPTADEVIYDIQRQIMMNPNKRTLVVIGLHGEQNGSATYAWWAFTKDHFQKLFDACANNQYIQLFIMSCWSSRKTNSLLGNVIMSSSEQVSYVSYTNFFIESFMAWESFYQAHVYAMMHYHQSLLPTSYCNNRGEIIELCPLTNISTTQQPL